MLGNIPKTRLVAYIAIIGMLPVLFALFNFYSQSSAVEELHNAMIEVQQLVASKTSKQAQNMAVREHFRSADHFYIDKNLETLTFLKPEIESLQKLVNNKYFAGDETVKRRLDFLTGKDNKLLFAESNVQTYPFFQETTASLVHPIEINVNDLKQILSLIEGVPIGPFIPALNRPQLIIVDFKFDKKEATSKNDVFILNMKILKREYT